MCWGTLQCMQLLRLQYITIRDKGQRDFGLTDHENPCRRIEASFEKKITHYKNEKPNHKQTNHTNKNGIAP